jgi:putative addiction module antidote
MAALKLTQIGNSVGVILPKELLVKLVFGKGDTLDAVDQPDGVRLTTADPGFEAQLGVARKIMKRRRKCCVSWPSDGLAVAPARPRNS